MPLVNTLLGIKPINTALGAVFRVKPINRVARHVGGAILPAGPLRQFNELLPVVDPFDLALPDGKSLHWLPQRDIISRWIRLYGWDAYEPESVRLFHALARKARVVFDVGAYLGYFAALGAAARDGNKAFAFEAVPSMAEKCAKMVAANRSLDMEVISAAVGRTDGTTRLYFEDNVPDSSTEPEFRVNRRSIEVPSLRLDTFVQERGLETVDLLKIDTETTEPDVLAGMAETVRRFRPTLLIEVLSVARVAELQAFLDENDYACAWIHENGPVPRARIEPDPTCRYMNYLFYPREPVNEVAAAAHALLVSESPGATR